MFARLDESVANCMKYYNLEDQIDTVKHEVGLFKEKEEDIQWQQQRMQNTRHQGVETEVN